jgi:hypothetical protein
LFTNEDNPNKNEKKLREASIQRARDLGELGIDIELFSMNKPNSKFDVTKFYQHVISVAEDEDTGTVNFDASGMFEELRARVRRKEFKKRAITRLSFYIGTDIEIAVRMLFCSFFFFFFFSIPTFYWNLFFLSFLFFTRYNLISETKKGSYVWLDGKTNQPLKTVTKVCERVKGRKNFC